MDGDKAVYDDKKIENNPNDAFSRKRSELPDDYECFVKTQLSSNIFTLCIDGLESFVLYYDIDWANWCKPYSILKFSQNMVEQASNSELSIFFNDELPQSEEPYFTILCNKESNRDLSINEIVEKEGSLFIELMQKTEVYLNQKVDHEILIKLFDFPPEYKNICSQYLMWFGEFLKNLGIEADVHTEPKNGQTALIVSPKEAPELLNEIEKLFYQYLALPYAELLPASKQTPQEMYAYQSAMNQIDNLKNQMQMKDTMLQLQQATNATLSEKLILQANQPLLLESLQDEKKYDFFNGLISIPAKQSIGKNKNVSIDLDKLFSKKKDDK